ncbi:MAG: hypothetical protein EON88_29425, partial [Brevundimonas sp.]
MLIELAFIAAITQDAAPPQLAAGPTPVTRRAGDLPWARRPSIEYPARALSASVLRGEAVVECAVAPDGAFSGCTVVD